MSDGRSKLARLVRQSAVARWAWASALVISAGSWAAWNYWSDGTAQGVANATERSPASGDSKLSAAAPLRREDCTNGNCEPCIGRNCGDPAGSCPQADERPEEQGGDPPALSAQHLPPLDLAHYVADEEALVDLGKALFWDKQVGSMKVACASCHFHAGADNRITNQLNPGSLDPSPAGRLFSRLRTGAGGPNYTLNLNDFPFHLKADITNRDSTVLSDTNDVVSSSGVFRRIFQDVQPGSLEDICTSTPDAIFSLNNSNTRRVPPRNSPTVINAAFNHRNFWDGKANEVFNGVDPLGQRTNIAFPQQGVWEYLDSDVTRLVQIQIRNSSLASQAVGPTVSQLEMSCEALNSAGFADPDSLAGQEMRFLAQNGGRNLPLIGRKLIDAEVLQFQTVHPEDSRLGKYRGGPSAPRGLGIKYRTLIERAFHARWWKSNQPVQVHGSDIRFTQMEANFSLFFGLAVQHYERTLVSDRSPFDDFRRDGGSTPDPVTGRCFPLSKQAHNGLRIFKGQSVPSTGYGGSSGVSGDGKCINCHATAVFTKASTLHLLNEAQEGGLVERMLMANNGMGPALYDNGFYNIGVRPWREDLGVGADDGVEINGRSTPLSFTGQYVDKLLTGRQPPDPFFVDPCTFEEKWTRSDFPYMDAAGLLEPLSCSSVRPLLPQTPEQRQEVAGIRQAVKGAFKTPGLRNIELTGPYFHNGGQATLEQVISFYNRGGDFHQANAEFLDPDIKRLNLSAASQGALVAFLKSLTDPRVVNESAPFDHPSLELNHGHNASGPCTQLGAELCDNRQMLPAVGARGRSALNPPLPPLLPFDRYLPR
jgi:cytochrome c peroxidase